jgi:hypothetical protein
MHRCSSRSRPPFPSLLLHPSARMDGRRAKRVRLTRRSRALSDRIFHGRFAKRLRLGNSSGSVWAENCVESRPSLSTLPVFVLGEPQQLTKNRVRVRLCCCRGAWSQPVSISTMLARAHPRSHFKITPARCHGGVLNALELLERRSMALGLGHRSCRNPPAQASIHLASHRRVYCCVGEEGYL